MLATPDHPRHRDAIHNLRAITDRRALIAPDRPSAGPRFPARSIGWTIHAEIMHRWRQKRHLYFASNMSTKMRDVDYTGKLAFRDLADVQTAAAQLQAARKTPLDRHKPLGLTSRPQNTVKRLISPSVQHDVVRKPLRTFRRSCLLGNTRPPVQVILDIPEAEMKQIVLAVCAVLIIAVRPTPETRGSSKVCPISIRPPAWSRSALRRPWQGSTRTITPTSRTGR